MLYPELKYGLQMHVIIRSEKDIDQHIRKVERSAVRAVEQILRGGDKPLSLLWRFKFELSGRHPIEDRNLNLIEQVNQTWTYLAGLQAVRQLLKCHQGEVFKFAPGAHAALDFDIESETPRKICAEVFAAVRPTNNGKLRKDLAKLKPHDDIRYRYVFFMSPCYRFGRRRNLERFGIEVWSVDMPPEFTSPTPASPCPAPPM